jgi:hypothetical protein
MKRASYLRMAATDVATAGVAALVGWWIGSDTSPIASPNNARDVVGLIMQVGAGVAALVLAPMAVVVALRPGVRTDAVIKTDGQRFANASVWSVLASVAAAALAFLSLVIGATHPNHLLAVGSIVMMGASLLAVFRVSRCFAMFLRARGNDDTNPIDGPYQPARLPDHPVAR